MKKKLLIFSVLMLIGSAAFSQRHLKGIKGLDILGGATGKGYYGEIGYNQYLSNRLYINISAREELAKIDGQKFYSTSLNPSLNFTIVKPTEWLFLNAKAGGSLFLDSRASSANDSLFSNQNKNTFNYGVFLGAEVEVFLSDKIVWVTNFRQNYNFQNYPGNWIFYVGTGLRLNIF